MSLNEHTQFFGAPAEPAPNLPPVSPPNMPPIAASVPPSPLPPPAAIPKPKRDNTKLVGALAIGAVAVGSVGFISWTMVQGEDTPEAIPAAPVSVSPIIPEAPKEELAENPLPPIEMAAPTPPPPAHKPSAAAPKPKPEPTPLAAPVLPEEIKIAEVSDDSEFKDAFIEARDQVGPGGLFEYKGQWYSTYSIEEWNVMPADMKEDFTNRVEPIVNPVETEAPAAVVEEEPLIVRLDTDNDGVEDTIMSDQNHDGLADIVIKDEPGEGISSIMYIDKDKDGKLETAIPVSDEGQVLEEQAETLSDPLEMRMQSAGSLAGSGEVSEVVDLNMDGGNIIETATPLSQEEHLLATHIEHGEVLSIENDFHHQINDLEFSSDSDLAADDLFTV
jgi:hypothetical protein